MDDLFKSNCRSPPKYFGRKHHRWLKPYRKYLHLFGRDHYDFVDKPDKLIILVETPGFEREHLTISVGERLLIVNGYRKTETEAERESWGEEKKIKFRIPLPVDVISEKSKARIKNGILEITLPKKEPLKSVEIE